MSDFKDQTVICDIFSEWVSEHNIECAEQIYQNDTVHESLPELIIEMLEAGGFIESDEEE